MLIAYSKSYQAFDTTLKVLDEDDLSVEEFDEELVNEFNRRTNLVNLDFVGLGCYDFALGTSKDAYATILCTDSRNSIYLLTVKARGGAMIMQKQIVIKKGRLYLDYINLDIEVHGDKYFEFVFSGMDKHYYREDREEYFKKSVIIDTRGRVIKETEFTIADNAPFYAMVKGHLAERAIVSPDGRIIDEGKRIC